MIDVRVVNGPQFRRALKQTENGFDDLKDANARAAAYVAARSREAAPHRSGRLAGSIKGNRAAGRAVVSTRLVYGAPLHWGVGPRAGQRGPHNIRASLFITDTAAATESEWLPMYVDNVQTVIDRNMATVR